ncbi:MAG: polyprenol monophosphomannose synthase [Bacteroidales bacterium]|nr:polyprenol monophosphomannose synthase [Bacteroidales bacterium]
MDKKLVIIPTYNEKENIADIIEAVFSLEGDFHVLVIDDGSPDGTAAIVKSLMAAGDIPESSATPTPPTASGSGSLPLTRPRVARDSGMSPSATRLHLIERSGKLGLGTAYLTGFKWALENGYDYVFEMDADFSHDPKDLVRLHEACSESGADLAVGSRYCNGVSVVDWPMSRIVMSYFASTYVRGVLRMHVYDTTAGFVCYSRKVLETINLDGVKMKGYGFQIEMKYTAWKLGFKLKEVPIIFTNRQKGTSKMSGGIFGEAFWGVIGLRFRRF